MNQQIFTQQINILADDQRVYKLAFRKLINVQGLCGLVEQIVVKLVLCLCMKPLTCNDKSALNWLEANFRLSEIILV